jgi:hypothetical protein
MYYGHPRGIAVTLGGSMPPGSQGSHAISKATDALRRLPIPRFHRSFRIAECFDPQFARLMAVGWNCPSDIPKVMK